MSYKLYPHFRVEDDNIIDGEFIQKPSFCQHKRKGCLDYYQEISLSDGFHTCPYGFASYVGEDEARFRYILTSLKITDHYDKKKFKMRHITSFFPELPVQNFLNSLTATQKVTSSKTISHNMLASLSDAIHEIRKLNSEIKFRSEKINKEIEASGNIRFIQNDVQDIFAHSSLISTRLNFFDYEVNPDLIIEHKNIVEVRKRFDKVRYCMNSLCRRKNFEINFTGSCYLKTDAYSVFDLLPYILIENAHKYSPQRYDIEVVFDEHTDYVDVSIINIGPQATSDDIEKAFLPRYRGKYAFLSTSGTGTGLYFAKKICDLHDIRINLQSSSEILFITENIPYSKFSVDLRIKRASDYI